MIGRRIGGPTIATAMDVTQATARARRTAKAEQLTELKKAQEEAEAWELGKAAAMSDLERMRLEYLESQTGNVMVRKEPVDKLAEPSHLGRYPCRECRATGPHRRRGCGIPGMQARFRPGHCAMD